MAQVTVSTTAVNFTAAKRESGGKNLYLRNPKTNTASVFVDSTNAVTVSGATRGLELAPGEVLNLSIGSGGCSVWAIAATAQSLVWAIL